MRKEYTGIIPALAGNTTIRCSIKLRFRDHPRTRGEHIQPEMKLACIQGSSPHSRGTLLHEIVAHGQEGIIPALAGNTDSWLTTDDKKEDHPRTRGEHHSKNCIAT